MSLLCVEKGRDIIFGEPLKAGTRRDVQFYSAICDEVISRIPEDKRRKTPCRKGKGGVDIHEATSGENFNGSYTLCDFTLGKFCFFINQGTAEKYLPNHIKSYEKE